MSQADIPLGSVFATHAPAMRRAGFAVVPARGKQPIRKGYRKWRFAPGLEIVAEWAEQDPDADIVYVPGLSRAKPAGTGMVTDKTFEARIRELVTGHPMLEQIAEAMLAARAALLEQFNTLHKAVLKIVRQDEVCRRFMTTPSVGAIVAMLILAIGGVVAVIFFLAEPAAKLGDQAEGDPQRSALRLNASWASRALLRDTH